MVSKRKRKEKRGEKRPNVVGRVVQDLKEERGKRRKETIVSCNHRARRPESQSGRGERKERHGRFWRISEERGKGEMKDSLVLGSC